MTKDNGNGGDYDVGYGKPPKKHQFRAGRSGNPKGRPKGAKGLRTDLREELSQRVPVTENGKTRKVSKQRLILKSLVAKAAKGDVRAAEKIVSLQIQMFGFEDERTTKQQLSDNDRALLEDLIGDLEQQPDDTEAEAAAGGADDGDIPIDTALTPDDKDDSNDD